jgi:hypothetical protein
VIITAFVVVLVLLAGAVVAVVLLNRDDDTSADDSPSTPSTPASTASAESTASSASPTATVDTSAIAGHWLGTYTCAQGATGLSLDVIPRSATELTAIFHFRKIPQNPDVPEGSYKLSGTLEDGKLRLRKDAWIDRPKGFVMVGLNARVTDPHPQKLIGAVTNFSCDSFTITRQ